MNDQDLKSLYARWQARQGAESAGPDAEAIARWSLQPPEGEAADAAVLEMARVPGALAAYGVAREIAPNAGGLARALVTRGGRLAANGHRTRPMVWAAAAAAALMLLVVDGVERRREHAQAMAAHDVITAGSFEGGDAPRAASDTLFRSDFDDG